MCKILIVDDEYANRLLLKEILKYSNHKLLEASNGEEALRIAESQRPDCILMDIQMPIMDGIEATLEIRKRCNTKIFGLTANTHFIDKDGIFDEILSKPINIKKLHKIIEDVYKS